MYHAHETTGLVEHETCGLPAISTLFLWITGYGWRELQERVSVKSAWDVDESAVEGGQEYSLLSE